MTAQTPEVTGDLAVRDRLEAYPWPAGLAAGVGAFVAGYLVIVVYALVGIASVPGTLAQRVTSIGFVLYNAHNVPLVGETTGNAVAPSVSLLQNASQPLVYLAVPVVVLVVTGVLFTRYRGPTGEVLPAVATALAMTLGYLLFALVGTYVFTGGQEFAQGAVVFHPSRVGTLLLGTLYPLVFGFVGSLLAESAWGGDE